MAARERSRGACWTCRLRKKKCDEGRPICSVCNTLRITCHGYGTKPDWMDGAIAQKKMAEATRNAVKETSNRKRRIENPQDCNSLVEEGKISPQLPPKWQRKSPTEALVVDSLRPDESERREVAPVGSGLDEDEAGLIMHYLDRVFPLQFRFYASTHGEGGRGWLLSIILRTKPIYHAVLGIAAYHQHYDLYYGHKRREDLPSCPILDDLQKHYVLTLEGLQQHLERITSDNKTVSLGHHIEVSACIALLISLEVFKGSGQNWQIHLKAASTIVPAIRAAYMTAERSQLSATHETALHFFSSVLTWYDILSCMSTGLQPFSDRNYLDSEVGYIHLDQIMGCENWVMLSIMDITALEDWKNRLQADGKLSMPELAARGFEIETRLENGLKSLHEALGDSPTQEKPNTDSGAGARNSKHIISLVTRVFACSALVYLHVTLLGPYPELPEIHNNVSSTIAAFRALPERNIIRNLTWPMCVAGCMATGEQERSFRDIATVRNTDSYAFGSSSYALDIMEECWRMRKSDAFESDNSHWMSAMASLELDILLV